MKPLLLIDVGNTRMKWAEAQPLGAIRMRGHVVTGQVTAAWIAAFANKFSGRRVVVASVVPALTKQLRRSFPEAIFVSGTLPRLPLAFHYPRPGEIGADRLAAAIGAQGKGLALVISCGTATAFSVLDRRGRFCGGAIMPGMATQLAALLGATAQLPKTTLPPNPRALGRSSRAAIRAGVVLGYRGGLREIIERLRQELGAPSARLIVTGGEAGQLRHLKGIGRVEFRPLLVFEGLRIIAAATSGS
jgi:type III pantothenate kinase